MSSSRRRPRQSAALRSDPEAGATIDLDHLLSANRLRSVIEAPDPFAAGLGVRYQPQLSVPGGELIGIEALMWVVDPGVEGLAAPAALGDLVEDAGLMERLTLALVEAVGDEARQWLASTRAVPVGINLPAAAVLRPGFGDRLTDRLAQCGLTTASIAVVLGSALLATASDEARSELAELRLRGVRVVLDHFGTGPADSGVLRLCTADEIKLHPQLLVDLLADEGARARVADLVEAGHEAGIRVGAQAIDDDRQLDVLRRLGIDAVQGPLLADPVDAAAFAQWVDQQYPADRTRALGDRAAPGTHRSPDGDTDLREATKLRFAPRTTWRGQPAFLRVPVEGWRNTSNRLPVKIADYSWTGVGFFLDELVVLPSEWEVVLEIDTVSIPMHVRRSVPVERSRLTYHGAEFVDPGPATAAELERVALHRVEDHGPAPDDGGGLDPGALSTRQWVVPTDGESALRPTRWSVRRRRTVAVGGTGSPTDHAPAPAPVRSAPAPRPIALATAAEQRIGRRYEVRHPVSIIPPPGPGRRRRRPTPIVAEMFNLSVSGAAVLARTTPSIQPGRALVIEIDGRRGGARVRRVADVSASGETFFGLEFTDERLSSTIIGILDAIEAEDRSKAP